MQWKALGLIEIVKVEAPLNLEAAKETVLSIDDPARKTEALLEIIRCKNPTHGL